MSGPILVVGGGIAGLTFAAAARQRGLSVRVFERSPVLGEVGAGLLLAANAFRVLAALGLGEPILARGARLRRGGLKDWRGRVLSGQPIGPVDEALGAPSLGMHRADLHEVLASAVPAQDIVRGERLVGVSQTARQVVLRFASGREEVGDVLVGADGVHSAVRLGLLGPSPTRDAGELCWRGVTPASAFPADSEVHHEFWEGWAPGLRFGLIPVGGGRISWHCYFRRDTEPEEPPPRARDALLQRFGGWYEPVRAAIEAADLDRVLRTENRDRPPGWRWHQGRGVLLGDAAHPLTPNIGMGAALAIESAWVLAGCLARADHARAFRDYERARGPRVAAVTTTSWLIGKWASTPSAPLRRLRELGMRATPDWLAQATSRRFLDFRI